MLPYMGTRPPTGIGSLRDCGTVHQGDNNANKAEAVHKHTHQTTPQQSKHSTEATWSRTVGTQSCNALPNNSTEESQRQAARMQQGRTAHIRREASCAKQMQAITHPPQKPMLRSIASCLYTWRRKFYQLFPHRCSGSRLCILHCNSIQNPCSRHGPATPKPCPRRASLKGARIKQGSREGLPAGQGPSAKKVHGGPSNIPSVTSAMVKSAMVIG